MNPTITYKRIAFLFTTAKDAGVAYDFFTRIRCVYKEGVTTDFRIGATTLTTVEKFNKGGDAVVESIKINGPVLFGEDETIASPELLKVALHLYCIEPDVSYWTNPNNWTIQGRRNLTAQLKKEADLHQSGGGRLK